MRTVLYVAHPLAPTTEEIDAIGHVSNGDATNVQLALRANLERAMRWLSWLRRSFPETTFIAPWIAAVLSGEDDADPNQREAGLVDACAVVALLDGIVLCGGRVSRGMACESTCTSVVFDLTSLGSEPPGPKVGAALFGWGEFVRLRRGVRP